MIVTKSTQPGLLLPMFLLTVAVIQGLLDTSAACAEESVASKSLFRFFKQQPSMLEKTASVPSSPIRNDVQNLPQVQSSNNRTNRRPNGRIAHAIFDMNMSPVEHPVEHPVAGPVVSASGLLPLDSDRPASHADQQPRPLRRLSVEPDPNDIPAVQSIDIEKVEYTDVISNPVLGPSHEAANFSLTSAMQNAPRPAGTQTPVPTPDDHASDSHLHNINVAAMKSAMFNGIQPDVTPESEVVENMGQPDQVMPIDAATKVLVYSLDDLGRMEITIKQSKVESLVWLLPEAYPSEQIRSEGLGSELRGIRPIHVPDSEGYILGMLFPEKGVIFSFVKSNKPGEPSLMVHQIAIEPLTSWPFQLRGERYLTISNAKAKWDLRIAVELDPNNDRARWLLAKAFLADGQLPEAQRECKFAIQINPDQPQYHVTLAEIIGTAGYTKEARQYLDSLLPYCNNMAQLRGHAECLLGDFYRDDIDIQDLLAAKKHYETAIEAVTPLLNSPNPTLQQQAKMVLVKTYLSMAQCISLSNWQNKEDNLPQWLEGAESFAMKMVMENNMTREILLDVAVGAITAYLNCPELEGLEKWIDKLQSVTDEIVSQLEEESTIDKIENQFAAALYDVQQIYEARRNYPQTLLYAKKAIQYFERHAKDSDDIANIYRQANLYFQLGTLEASGQASRPPAKPDKKAHVRAAGWFAKAIPLFQQIETHLGRYEQPVLGQMYVSIGFTYWEVGERDYAVQITEYGISKLESAVDSELISVKVLATPYTNLSNMYENVGRSDEAEAYYLLAKDAANNSIAKGSSSNPRR